LQDDAELTAQALNLEVAQIMAVNGQPPAIGEVEAHEQVGDGCFARATAPYQGDGRACRDVQRDVM
jgi:hypothetical protein